MQAEARANEMGRQTLALTRELITRKSVTPDDAGCQALLAQRLAQAGFKCEHLRFGEVDNLWAVHGQDGPTLVLLGHTDVVPPGPREAWASDPFAPEVREGVLYGRGAADMKGSVAAFVVAVEEFAREFPDHPGRIAILLTSDEEGDAIDGVRKVADVFRARGERMDWCVTGEPSSKAALGDLLRVGRRGSLSGRLRVKGIQGHVAYPEKARNPIHQALPALAELSARAWDDGYPEFPPTSFQISNIQSGTGANNVIPGDCALQFNFRFNPGWTAERLESEVHAVLDRHGLDYELHWHRSGEPFLTGEGRLRAAVRAVLMEQCGTTPDENTGGGTSDARFIAPLGAEVVELGPINASIHKVNEHVAIEELERLPALYRAIAERLLLA